MASPKSGQKNSSVSQASELLWNQRWAALGSKMCLQVGSGRSKNMVVTWHLGPFSIQTLSYSGRKFQIRRETGSFIKGAKEGTWFPSLLPQQGHVTWAQPVRGFHSGFNSLSMPQSPGSVRGYQEAIRVIEVSRDSCIQRWEPRGNTLSPEHPG